MCVSAPSLAALAWKVLTHTHHAFVRARANFVGDSSIGVYMHAVPPFPYDPGEQGDPLHTEAPAKMERGGKQCQLMPDFHFAISLSDPLICKSFQFTTNAVPIKNGWSFKYLGATECLSLDSDNSTSHVKLHLCDT